MDGWITDAPTEDPPGVGVKIFERAYYMSYYMYRYPEGFRSVVVIAKVGASRDETKTQARKSSQLM